jgi:hypothetical protein
MQVAAGVAFALGFTVWTYRLVGGSVPVLNSDCRRARRRTCRDRQRVRAGARERDLRDGARAVPVVLARGVLWWLARARRDRAVCRRRCADPLLVLFVAASALIFETGARRLAWPLAACRRSRCRRRCC